MRRLVCCLTLFLTFTSATAYAQNSPVFMDRVKGIFSKSSDESSKKTAPKPVPLSSKNKNSSSSSTDTSELSSYARNILESRELHRKRDEAVARRRAGQEPYPLINPAATPVARKTVSKPKIVIPKKKEGKEKSNVPQPIFKNYR